MLTIDEAVKNILETVKPLGSETVGILESYGRIIAEEVRADSDVPFCDNSAMDGFAVIAEDVKAASEEKPVELKILEKIQAGRVAEHKVEKGTAVRIMTGAPIPQGADAVVMVEYTETRDDRAFIKAPVEKGANIRIAGEDVRKGQLLFSHGIRIGPAETGILASAGCAPVKVGRRPVVGILSTGDEIIEPHEPAGIGKVRNSNSYALAALCSSVGASPRYMGIVPDRRNDVEAAFKLAAANCDVILTSGGVSMGDFDLVRTVLEEIGQMFFWKVKVKPGRPLAFGLMTGVPMFGLPGNPVSAMVSFELFVRPALLKMMGARELFRTKTTARMEHEVSDKPARAKIMRGVATRGKDGVTVRTTGHQGSGILMSMLLANCFIIMPEGISLLKKGETVEVIPLDRYPI